MSGFICVHVGAGHHAAGLEPRYKQLCREASKKGVGVLSAGGCALDAAVEATMMLENSPMTNSGYGSNLNCVGRVECDASVMNGENLSFGACGAVAGVKNPVVLAKLICERQLVPLPLGRIPPSLLAGEGAFKYAAQYNIPTVLPTSLISSQAQKMFRRCQKRLKWIQENSADLMKSCEEEDTKQMQGVLDTVGAVCVDAAGNIAAACSSGGVLLKREGRIGQAAIQGAGCWAESDVGIVTTGCGEHLVSTCLAREIARNIKKSENAFNAVHATMHDDFLGSPLLSRVEEKLAGVLILRTDGDVREMIYAHTTQSMCIGYASTNDKPKSRMSRLPEGSKHGSSVVIEVLNV